MGSMVRHPIIEEDLSNITQFNLPWDDFADKTILVSGANGFLPAYMVETLLYLNETSHRLPSRVIGLVRNIHKARARFAGYLNRTDLTLVEQDVARPLAIDVHIDYIIHAASQASPKYFVVDPVGTLSANVLGTHNLLKLAHDNHVIGFLYFSSSEIYGQVLPDQIPTDEMTYGYLDPPSVRACYSESKRMGETMCAAWAYQFGVPAKIVRPFHTYGPGMALDDGRVFADFVAQVLQNQDILVKSSGMSRRAFCYLADATIGFFTVLLKGEIGQAYNIGKPDAEMSILELAEMLTTLFPDKKLRVIIQLIQGEASTSRPSAIMRSSPNVARVYKLGWYAQTSAPTGFARTIRSYV